MDLTKFQEKYHIISQEPVDILYDVTIQDEAKESDTFEDIINDYYERNERVFHGERIQYFIQDENEKEIFRTVHENELFDEIIRLTKQLD